MKWRRQLVRAAVVLAVLLVPTYIVLFRYSPDPGAPFALDLAKARALADSLPGAKPSEVRVETIFQFNFFEAVVAAGDPWRKTAMPVSSYQLVFPDKTIVVDSAMDEKLTKESPMTSGFDAEAYNRMAAALDKADQIVVTHEHGDHLGGLADDPHFAQLIKAIKLTDEQVANAKGLKPAVLPAEAMKGYQPLKYEGMTAIAPGVVLVKAPGHTPGSQMVYVKRADGRELLFLGDVAWHARQIEAMRERPLAIAAMVGEDRPAVEPQLVALNALGKSAPEVKQVPGHDGDVLSALIAQSYLTRGFK